MKKIFFFSILSGALLLFATAQAQHKYKYTPKKPDTTSEKKAFHYTPKKTQTQTASQSKAIPISNPKTAPQYPIEHGKKQYPIEHGKKQYPIEHGKKAQIQQNPPTQPQNQHQ